MRGHDGAGEVFHKIGEHPSGDDGVAHHEQIVAADADVLHKVPFLSLLFKHVKGGGDAALTAPTYGKLHGHDRQTKEEKKADVDEYEDCAAIRTGDDRKPIHIAQSYGASGGDQNESEPGGKFFTLLHKIVLSKYHPNAAGAKYALFYCTAFFEILQYFF